MAVSTRVADYTVVTALYRCRMVFFLTILRSSNELLQSSSLLLCVIITTWLVPRDAIVQFPNQRSLLCPSWIVPIVLEHFFPYIGLFLQCEEYRFIMWNIKSQDLLGHQVQSPEFIGKNYSRKSQDHHLKPSHTTTSVIRAGWLGQLLQVPT